MIAVVLHGCGDPFGFFCVLLHGWPHLPPPPHYAGVSHVCERVNAGCVAR